MKMDNFENNELFDLGSTPIGEDFDPFALEDEPTIEAIEEPAATQPQEDAPVLEQAAPAEIVEPAAPVEDVTPAEPVTVEPVSVEPSSAETAPVEPAPVEPASVEPAPVEPAKASKASGAKAAKAETALDEKPPVFVYAGATETISDTSMTFDELRIEKARDFPELDDGKRVSWSVEYGKITKTVTDPKGTSIGKMKSDIETSKEFQDSLKRARDKNPDCKIKPRVTAQSKGTAPEYKGVFTTLEEAEAAGKIISIVPSQDGKVYEIRSTEMGRFITPVSGCELLSEVQAGFIPALPRIPSDLMMQILAFFRHFVQNGTENEALLNIYWDKENQEFIVDAPEQVVTKISVDSQLSEKFASERYIHYMDIHSHNTMSAFFSPVDNHDERATRLYTVVGRLDKCMPEVRTRISNGGKFLEIDPSEVFEFTGCSFPKEWKDRVNVKPKHKKGIRKAVFFPVRKVKKMIRKKAAAL